MKTVFSGCWLVTFLLTCAAAPKTSVAQESAEDAITSTTAEQAERFRKFEALLNRTNLVGHFTIIGREDNERSVEEYTIQSVKKVPQGDFWLFNARMKYGGRDVPMPPVPLEVKWAGDTPMITLTDFTIPLVGTFSCRVVFYNNKYAGTWTHGEVGGHLFGVLEKLDQDQTEPVE